MKKIQSLFKKTNVKHFILGVALSFVIAFGVGSVIAGGDAGSGTAYPFVNSESSLENRIGSLSVYRNGSARWIDPLHFHDKSFGSREECITTYKGDDKNEVETCLDVNGIGGFSKLTILDLPSFFTKSIFLNSDASGSTIEGLPKGLVVEDFAGTNDDSIMVSNLGYSSDGSFMPRDISTTRNLCAEAATGKLYPCVTVPSSCFVKDTKVILANGTMKNIQDIKIGDILKGEKTNNKVLAYDRPLVESRKLYSFNEGKYFVTEEHPFMTSEGWKSLSPEATDRENAGLVVDMLKVGDILTTDSKSILLENIKEVDPKDDTKLYNFILDGDHTYYADGYLVNNKVGIGDGNSDVECTGVTPAHSARCAGDNATADKTLVSSCSEPLGSTPKCEYECVDGYHYSDENCVMDNLPEDGECEEYSDTYASQPATNTVSGCRGGTYDDISDSTDNWRWRCIGSDSGTSVSCSASKEVTYSCTGDTPTNATICSGDISDLTTDTTKTIVGSSTSDCGVPKCEYICDSGYHYEGGGVCVEDAGPTYSCTGTLPNVDVTICSGDDSGLTENKAKTLVTECTAGTKCEYIQNGTSLNLIFPGETDVPYDGSLNAPLGTTNSMCTTGSIYTNYAYLPLGVSPEEGNYIMKGVYTDVGRTTLSNAMYLKFYNGDSTITLFKLTDGIIQSSGMVSC